MLDTQQQFAGILRAVEPGIYWLRTKEEQRVKTFIRQVVASRTRANLFKWTVTQGMQRFNRRERRFSKSSSAVTKNPLGALNWCANQSDRSVVVFSDLATWLDDPMTLRSLKDLMETNKNCCIATIDIAAPPPQLPNVPVYDWPAPSFEEMGTVLRRCERRLSRGAKEKLNDEDFRDQVLSALMGLTLEEAESALMRSRADVGEFDVKLLLAEKKKLIKGSGLDWYEPEVSGLDEVGGLDALKDYFVERRSGFTQEAKDYGIPPPKGVLLLGVQGCGKSLTAKCVAETWQLPLLRMDVGSLFSKWVGESESKMRQALTTVEVVAPCILWLDEIEKAFASSGGESDGGTSKRMFGTFLTWMQEHKAGIFLIGTSNDISQLPAEFCRAGRWDDIWFIDLPNKKERVEIANVMKRKYDKCKRVNVTKVAENSEEYTGAEIEAAFVDSLFPAFSDGKRLVKTSDVLTALKSRVPLSAMMKEKVSFLRNWAKGRARLATSTVKASDAG
jgi:hypothetical protein